jgi:hypothetical protein
MISVQPLGKPPFALNPAASQWACGEAAFPSVEEMSLVGRVAAVAAVWSSQASPMALFPPIGAARDHHLECVVSKAVLRMGDNWD